MSTNIDNIKALVGLIVDRLDKLSPDTRRRLGVCTVPRLLTVV